MTRYRYLAKNADGHQLEGELECDTLTNAITELESRGWSVGSVERITESFSDGIPTAANASYSAPDPASLSSDNQLQSHFHSVLANRDQLIPALESLASELPRGAVRREVAQLVRLLKTAKTSKELSASPHATRWLPLLLTGMTQESASERLGELLVVAARDDWARSQRRRLLAYPAVVLMVTLLVLALICTLIVPSFKSMFEDFGIRLPYSTQLLIGISDQITEHFLETVAGVALTLIALYAGVRLWLHASLTTRLFGRFVAGNASSVSAMASFISQLTDLLSIGISLPDALWLAGEGCHHRFFQRAAEDLARHAYDSGQPLQACSAAEKFPGNLMYALTAGPNGTPHLLLLHELGVIYADHATHRTSWMTGAIAQISILFIGLAVAFAALALFGPLFSLVQGLS